MMKIIHTFVILAYKESDDLEDCIKSVLKQSVKSNIVIATSTPNDYITDLASQYGIGVMVNETESNKGNDYNFALSTFNTKLITIVHQDDLYHRNYAKEVIKCYEKNKDANIIFTDYYEIHKDVKVKHSLTLLKKKFKILPLKHRIFQNKKYFKIRSLKYGQAFCTSSVTFVRNRSIKNFFPTNLTYYNDWQGFINFANKKNTRMVYLNKKLVGYRIYDKEINMDMIIEKENILKEFWNHKIIDFLYRKYHKNK